MQNRRREGHGGDDESYCHVKRASEGAQRGLCGEIYKKSGSTTGEEFRVIGDGSYISLILGFWPSTDSITTSQLTLELQDMVHKS